MMILLNKMDLLSKSDPKVLVYAGFPPNNPQYVSK